MIQLGQGSISRIQEIYIEFTEKESIEGNAWIHVRFQQKVI